VLRDLAGGDPGNTTNANGCDQAVEKSAIFDRAQLQAVRGANASARWPPCPECHWRGTGCNGGTRFPAGAVFITVSTDHFGAHGDVSGFGELLERFAAVGQIPPDLLGNPP
jgi:hypothetical protein